MRDADQAARERASRWVSRQASAHARQSSSWFAWAAHEASHSAHTSAQSAARRPRCAEPELASAGTARQIASIAWVVRAHSAIEVSPVCSERRQWLKHASPAAMQTAAARANACCASVGAASGGVSPPRVMLVALRALRATADRGDHAVRHRSSHAYLQHFSTVHPTRVARGRERGLIEIA